MVLVIVGYRLWLCQIIGGGNRRGAQADRVAHRCHLGGSGRYCASRFRLRAQASGPLGRPLFDRRGSRYDLGRPHAGPGAVCIELRQVSWPEAKGGLGPALVGRALRHGDSDWAIYRTVAGGVPGTAMVGGLIVEEIPGAYRLSARPGSSGATRTGASVASSKAGARTDVRLPGCWSPPGTGEWLLPGGSYDGKRFSRDAEVTAAMSGALRTVGLISPRATPPMSLARRVGALPLRDGAARDGDRSRRRVRCESLAVHPHCPAGHPRLLPSGESRCRGVRATRLLRNARRPSVALDATSGQLVWDQTVADYKTGYSITSAPLPVGDLVITGIAGSEFPIRGFITAYDAATVALRWRFNTVPEPGDPVSKTWGGDSWKTGGGATWGSAHTTRTLACCTGACHGGTRLQRSAPPR